MLALVQAHSHEPVRLAAEIAAEQKDADARIAEELEPGGIIAEAIRAAV